MNFNAPFFLFFFLPITLGGSLLCSLPGLPGGPRLRRAWLLLASLIFYTWGEPFYLPLVLLTVLLNYGFGRRVEQAEDAQRRRWVTLAILYNIGLLAFFKLLVAWWPALLDLLQTQAGLPVSPLVVGYLRRVISLPVGLSFLTFQAVAYVVDVSHRRSPAEKNLWSFALYLLLFPRLVAGPIVRYREVAAALQAPQPALSDVATGVRRFILGLAKKVLLADVLAQVSGSGVFDQALPQLSAATAWLVLICYALQIYYDFSGYTDMAIGLGRIFGFQFPENFNNPYIARSISEFWRRWHMTLSGWFRDYVFYPLERARRGRGGLRQALNILLVFLLTGLWHGVTINFILWGLLHGAAIALESSRPGRWLRVAWRPLQHLYALTIILVGWVFFRSNSPAYALAFLGALMGGGPAVSQVTYSLLPTPGPQVWVTLLVGLALALPISPALKARIQLSQTQRAWAENAALLVLLLLSFAALTGATYQPYIYGAF